VDTEPNQDRAAPTIGGGRLPPRGERSIGTILIQAGRLTLEGAERTLRHASERGIRFGAAAIELGLLSQADIDFALARQFDYPYLTRGQSRVSEEVIMAYAPAAPQAQAISFLRSQLMLRWFDGSSEHKTLAIISAEHAEGRSFILANLAVAFAQLGQKTVLVDTDMRNPCQHRLFGTDGADGVSALLSGRGTLDSSVHKVAGLPGLSVLAAGPQPPNPLELLARPLFPQLLLELNRDYEVVLLDSPPTSRFADAQTIAVRAGAAMVVARKNFTRLWQVRGASESVTLASSVVIGTVLNDY
jgi:receptor protein-tyrosine kinase